MTYPRHDDLAPESVLADQLTQARQLLRLTTPTRSDAGGAELTAARCPSPEFHDLLWFDLPEVCLR